MKIDSGKNISGVSAILFIMVLSLVVAWVSVNTAREIIDNAKISPTLNGGNYNNLINK